MEVTCAATLRSVRTPWEATAACVPGVTDLREWAFPAWVSRLGTFALPHNLFSENRRRLRNCLNLSGSHPSPCVRTYCNSFFLPDVDECQQSPNPCAYQCRNVPGTFRCLCPSGTVLLGDGRSCAGLERGVAFSNGTRVRARLRPQLVSSLGRPILSRSHGVSRITRQSCPVGYTTRDGTCVGNLNKLYKQGWVWVTGR